jgi:D-3-phosphoglycerate dehydrogenase
MARQFSFPREKVKILLLEGVHAACVEKFAHAGYTAELVKEAYSEDELCRAIAPVHILGIRSKTLVSKKVLEHAKHLLALGCF